MNKMVYLRWLDSAIELEWSRASQEGTGLSEIETIGYLILEDEKHVQVAQSNFGNYKYNAIIAIPKAVILERRALDVRVRKKKSV